MNLRSAVAILIPAALMAASSVHEFSLTTIDGKPAPLSAYKGKAVLLVNVASKCGYTKQYTGLQALYEKYKDKGLVIVGVPANNFGGQEPGTNEEIATFCSRNYNVTFPHDEQGVRQRRRHDSTLRLFDAEHGWRCEMELHEVPCR